MSTQALIPIEQIAGTILQIRGQKVILDADLARLYGVSTSQFNQAVKRNFARFPEDFMFHFTQEEDEILKSQNVISSGGHGGRRKIPHAFTEHGAVMAATVLNSPQAVAVSVFVVRAFVCQRELLSNHAELALKLERIERRLQERFSYQEDRLDDHESQLEQIIEAVRHLQEALTRQETQPRRPIGFRGE
ncbi:MAG: ORF6N domain-containing protein [Armatimonadota bacterium]